MKSNGSRMLKEFTPMVSIPSKNIQSKNIPGKIKYSRADVILLSLLSKDKQISSIELAEKYYEIKPPRPVNAMQSITSMMRSLIENLDYNEDKYRIEKERNAPNPMLYRKVMR